LEDERVQGWVRRAREGDILAFEDLVSHFQRRVLALAYQLTGDPDDAQEIAQDVFLRAHRYLSGFHLDRPFTPWLLRITVHAAWRHRRRSRAHLHLVPMEEAEAQAVPSREPAGETAVLEGERRRLLTEALDELAPQERAVFVLREMQGLSTEEVARALKIRPVTVRRHASRARARLLELLKGRYT